MRKLYFTLLSKRFITLAFVIVSALSASAQTDISIGTGTTGNDQYSYPNALQDYYEGSRAQFLYRASELIAAGMAPGNISSIKYNVISVNGTGVIEDMVIKIGGTAATTLSTSVWDVFTGPTSSTTSTDYQPVAGINTFTFATPFFWNGTDNILVEFCNGEPTNNVGIWYTYNPTIPWTTGLSFNGSHTVIDDNMGNYCGTPNSVDNAFAPNTTRPNITFAWTPATTCSGTPNAGTAVSSNATICPNIPFNLTLSGATVASGLTYQWQSSPDSLVWTNITGGTAAALTHSQAATSWYRAIVTCVTAADTSETVKVTSPSLFPAGTYTINGALPASSTNFQTFAAAINAMNCGIAGPVIFNVATATYNEQVTIPVINGTSSTNTVTFKGNLATISFNSTTSSNRVGIWLNGADFIRIDSLNVTATGTYGWGISMTNKADSNRITNCNITLPTTSTSTNYVGININGSVTSTFSSGNNGNGNLIDRNTVTGGYYGIIVYGSTNPYNVNNVISRNTVKEFYAYGIYTYGNTNVTISRNDISRPTRTTGGTIYSFYVSSSTAVLLEKNRVHNMYDANLTNTSSFYGFYISADGTPSAINRAENNVIYNINRNSGTNYGFYGAWYYYWHYYHNTVVFDDASSTSGSVYAMYTYGTGVKVRNNIIYVTRGGTGTKYLLYFSSIGVDSSDNNVLYLNAPAGTNYIGYESTPYATLAAWQTGTSNDLLSVASDPLFASPSTGNLYPNNTAIASIGASLGVATDILDVTRDVLTPTPGAIEIVPALGVDMGVKGLLLPVQKECYSNAETVTVTIRNYSATAINFATNPDTIFVSVTGPNATTFTPVIVNTGTLASDDTLDVVISTNYNMSVAGTYTFNATSSVINDANVNNNSMPPFVRNVAALNSGTISSNPPSYCVTGGTPTLSLNGSAGGSIQWQESVSATGPWTNVGTNSTTYTPASALTDTMFYRVIATCQANADTANVLTVELNNPQLLSTTPDTLCGSGTLNLQAVAAPGSTLNWYTDATGGTPVYTGTSFTTPVLSDTTSYYVTASSGGGISSVGKTGTTGADSYNTGSAYLIFDALSNFNLSSVTLYPYGTGTGTATIALQTSTGTTLQTTTVPVTGNTTPVPQVVPLNFNVSPGSNLRLTLVSFTGVSGFYRDYSVSSGISYPYTIPGVVSITNASISGYYYYFYNWQVSTACETPRQEVVALVHPLTSITSQPVTQSVCSATNVKFTVGVTGGGLSYQWMKDGQPITGETTDSLVLNNVTPTNNGAYTVVVTGVCGTVTSQAGNLVVAPGNSWTGLTSSDWHTASNWCGGVPTSTSAVYIPTGTPYSPVISGVAYAGNLTIDSLGVLTVAGTNQLNIYGNFINNKGTFNASSASVSFLGSANQNIDAMTAGTIVVNGAGITLNGKMIANNTLTLTNGNITLGEHDIFFTGSVNGSTSTHIVTNGKGSAISNNIGTTAAIIPIGPDAANYNPVTISNGQGRNYSARVETGLNPSITDNTKAINRTWTVLPNTFVNSNVTIGLQYADAHANSGANPAGIMMVGTHNGAVWHNFSGNGITPTGSASARVVTYQTVSFGPTVLSSPGGITFQTALPGIDPDVTGVMLLPNLVQGNTVLRVSSQRMVKINWVITDAQGRVVYEFSRQAMAGRNDIPLSLGKLASGTYHITGVTEKGKTQVVRFIKM